MPDVEKVEVKLTIKATTVVKLDKMRKQVGFSRNEMCNTILDSATKSVGLTSDDLAEVQAIISRNIEKRNALKTKKGIK
jgi:hypothetical protein